MNDSPPDDARLRSTEERMRHALGLRTDAPARSTFDHSTTTINGSHPQRRRFVRDGEVPVTIINRDHRQDDASGANQLDAARQAIRSQAAAKEHAERLLIEAQATIRDLQTKLAHERLAKDETIVRADAERKAVEQARETAQAELLAQRAAHERSEEVSRDAQATITNLSEKLHEAQQALTAAKAELAAERRKGAEATRAQTVAPATHAQANGHKPALADRGLVGRPREILAIQSRPAPMKPDANANARIVAKNVKRPGKLGLAAQTPAGKPIKWWLTAR